MADVTPTAAVTGSTAVLAFGSNTYHGIKRYRWSGQIQKQVEKFSTSAGIGRIVVSGGPEDTMAIDILVAAGDSATLDALKRDTSSATCELHPEGDSAGNIEIIFENGLIESSDFGGDIGQGGMLSLVISCDGDLTIQDAV